MWLRGCPAREVKSPPAIIFPFRLDDQVVTQLSAPGLNAASSVPSAFRRPMFVRDSPPERVEKAAHENFPVGLHCERAHE